MPAVRRWLHEALCVGHRLVAGAWVWDAAPERGVTGTPERLDATTFDAAPEAAVVRSEAATLTVPHRIDPDDIVALELVRRLAVGDGAPIVAPPLAAARWIGPGGLRLPAMLLAALPGAARPASSRLHPLVARALHGVADAIATSLVEARALGTVARELHAALGRPVAEGLGSAAIPATRRDVEVWALEAADALAALDRGLRT
ncbi:MAG: hypothetical protein MUF40_06960, partial [Gemmatimonadaceae bacterium]|nr:hypothetical protein [Gemmatimonadaceae bacterium]